MMIRSFSLRTTRRLTAKWYPGRSRGESRLHGGDAHGRRLTALDYRALWKNLDRCSVSPRKSASSPTAKRSSTYSASRLKMARSARLTTSRWNGRSSAYTARRTQKRYDQYIAAYHAGTIWAKIWSSGTSINSLTAGVLASTRISPAPQSLFSARRNRKQIVRYMEQRMVRYTRQLSATVYSTTSLLKALISRTSAPPPSAKP